MIDIIVIGAGAAGLAAGEAALAAGLDTLVIEAGNRVGGRAYTEWESFGTAFDHGCQWLHSASINPFRAIADRLGMRYRTAQRNRRFFGGGRWLSDAEAQAVQDGIEALYEAVYAAGRAGRDVAVAEVIAGHPQADPFRQLYTAIMAAEPDRVSVMDTFNYRETNENWPVEDGLGALVARASAHVPVRFACPATVIDWSGPGVAVETPQGRIQARAAILTVSTGVLASGAIRFAPGLPTAQGEAIAALPLGHSCKIAASFRRDPFGDKPPHFLGLLDRGPAGFGLQVHPFDRPMVTAYVSGTLAQELEAAGPAAMHAFLDEQIAHAFGADLLREIDRRKTTDWSSNPLVRGAYSVQRPGSGSPRATLGQPIAERLVLAGEAASVDAFSTVHGARLSGQAAFAALLPTLAKAA
ncbi:flavin monoamine oxidase family protein [Zavarzinia sp. CC-PAN008]|uniref:flavin monoamine oxidase family protein n=1 Tax=Zavarzinia sp. CC-PAN008 TaxID=3243332 RepID=UPI003F745BEE